jgi:hypothetical protein
MKVFKIRCSAIGHIMTNPKGAITELQLKKIDELSVKPNLTDKQKEELTGLINKRDNPELSATCKGYCEDWLKGQVYNRRIEFTNKYTEKGIIMEDSAIDFISEQLKLGMLFKSDTPLEDDFMTGETDVNIPDLVIDAKNSWSWETFPLFDTEIPSDLYYWQLQGYMSLTGKSKSKLCYVLSDTPLHIIEREARNYCFFNGYGELDMDIFNEFHKKLTYSDVDPKLKLKVFDIPRDDTAIQAIKDRVVECRKYIETLEILIPK